MHRCIHLWSARRFGLVHTTPEDFENGSFTLEAVSNVVCPHRVGEILKTQKQPILLDFVWVKLEQENVMIIVSYIQKIIRKFQAIFAAASLAQ